MQCISEATNILQCKDFLTLIQVIPVMDSIDNALIQAKSDNVAVIALFEHFLTGLEVLLIHSLLPSTMLLLHLMQG